VDIDNQAVGVGQEEGGILLEVVDVKDDAGEFWRDLRGADAGEEASVSDGEAFAGELGREVRVVEVEINAVRVLHTGGFELDLAAKIDGDAGVGGGRPVADAGDERERRGSGDGFKMRRGLSVRGCSADSGERRSEEDAASLAEHKFVQRTHTADSLGIDVLW